MTKAKLSERKLIRDFITRLSIDCQYWIDQDSGTVRTKSYFDFMLARHGLVIFVEAKLKPKSEWKAHQKLFKRECKRYDNHHVELNFNGSDNPNDWYINTTCFFGVEPETIRGFTAIEVFLKKLLCG